MKITAQDLKQFGIVDKIIDEPENGAQNDFERIIKDLKEYLENSINELQKLDVKELLENRNLENLNI